MPGGAPRQDFGAVAMPDGSIVIMGGGSGYNQYYNDVWRSTDNGATWTEMNASADGPRGSGLNSVVLQDGSIVIMGGINLVQSPLEYIYFNDVWRSTDNGATWTEMTSNAGWVQGSHQQHDDAGRQHCINRGDGECSWVRMYGGRQITARHGRRQISRSCHRMWERFSVPGKPWIRAGTG